MASWQPSERIGVPSAQQRWDALTFVHLGYEPDALGTLLPPGLELDRHDDLAWIGVTPFRLEASLLPVAPGPRMALTEVNVRTYVRDERGQDGLWFLSLELDQAAVAGALRSLLGLPYRWSDTWIDDQGDTVRYGATRRPPHRAGSLELEVAVGEPIERPDDFDTYLVGRWRAFTQRGEDLLVVPVEHEPWPLTRAELVVWHDDGFLASLGLPEPATPPHVHFSEGVDVELGWPRRTG